MGLWSFNVSTGLALKSAYVLIGLRREKETAGQGNNGEGEGGDFCRLATSVDCSSGRKFDRVQLSQARTQELDLGRKKVSNEAGRLGVSFYRQEKQRRDSDAL